MKRIRQRLLSLMLAASIACSWCVPVSAVETHDHDGHDHPLAAEHAEVCEVADVHVTKEAVAESCTKDGKTEEVKCLGCGKTLQKQTKIAKTGHNYQWTNSEFAHWQECANCGAIKSEAVHKFSTKDCADAAVCTEKNCGYEKAEGEHIWGKAKVTVKVTCVTDGEKTYTCTTKGCGATKTEVVEAHGEAVVDEDGEGYPATCDKDGLTDRLVCSECGKVVQKQTKIKKGHTWAAEKVDEVTHALICSVCGEDGGEEDHEYDVPCDEPGTCVLCGHEKESSPHQVAKWKTTKKVTCIEAGEQTGTCKLCGETVVEAINPHGEAVIEYGIPATCTEAGTTDKITCSECDKVLQKSTTQKALGHDFVNPVDGVNGHAYACSRCDALSAEEAHEYTVEDCDLPDTCTVCGHEKVAGEHLWVAGKVTKKSTCAVRGQQTYKCSLCGEEESRELDLLPHTEKVLKAKAVTCDKDGLTEGVQCSKCKTILVEQKVIPAQGHDEEITKEGYPATCTENGKSDQIVCKICKKTIQKQTSIPKLGHDFTEVKSDEFDHWYICTREDCGMESEYEAHDFGDVACDAAAACVICGYERAEGGEHNWGKEKVTKKATCTAEGEKIVTCDDCGFVETQPIKMLDHTIKILKGKAATCEKDGLTQGQQCSKCKTILEEQTVIKATGHVEKTVSQRVEPTCTTDGKDAKIICEVCNKTIRKDTKLKKLGHDFSEPEYNEKEHWYGCSRCDAEDKAQAHEYDAYCHEVGVQCACGHVRTEPGVHEWGKAKVTRKATCAEKGEQVVTCTLCGFQETQAIQKLPHTEKVIKGKAATCTEPGLTEGKQCSKCKEFTVVQEVIPALGHDIEILPAVEPTCTEKGLTEGEKCLRCKQTLVKQENVEALGHDIQVLEGYEPTCTEDGLTEGEQCLRCEKILTEQKVIEALGHDEVVEIEAKPATCLEKGWTARIVCGRETCGEVLQEQAFIEPLGHDIKILKAVEPTCTETGLTEGQQCARCDTILLEQEIIEALGHDEVVDIEGWPATCTEDGKTDKIICDRCDKVLQKQTKIDKLGHLYEELAYDEIQHWYECVREGCDSHTAYEEHDFDGASCEEEAECLECGYVKAAGDHILDNGKTITEPGCLTTGLIRYTCEECGKQTDVLIPALGHAPKTMAGKDATCEKDGLSVGEICSRCGEILKGQVVLDKLGHDEVVDIEGWPATCTEDGKTDKIICDRCDKVLQKQTTIKKLGHNYQWMWDEYDHWQECVREDCGEMKGSYEEHEYSSETDTTCDVCGAVRDVEAEEAYAVTDIHFLDQIIFFEPPQVPNSDELRYSVYYSKNGGKWEEYFISSRNHAFEVFREEAGKFTYRIDTMLNGEVMASVEADLSVTVTLSKKTLDPEMSIYEGEFGELWIHAENLRPNSLMVFDLYDSEGNDLTRDVLWTADETSYDGSVWMYSDGEPKYFHMFCYENYSLSKDGKNLSFTYSEMDEPKEIGGSTPTPPPTPGEIIASGTCGSLYWTLDSNGVLTISGEGDMYFDGDEAPWNGYINAIREIVIEDGAKSIAEYAFYGCSGLKTVTMTNSVTYVADYAFENCPSLTDVYFDGSEDDWRDINIGGWNQDLTYANIHCSQQPVVEDKYAITDFWFSENANGLLCFTNPAAALSENLRYSMSYSKDGEAWQKVYANGRFSPAWDYTDLPVYHFTERGTYTFKFEVAYASSYNGQNFDQVLYTAYPDLVVEVLDAKDVDIPEVIITKAEEGYFEYEASNLTPKAINCLSFYNGDDFFCGSDLWMRAGETSLTDNFNETIEDVNNVYVDNWIVSELELHGDNLLEYTVGYSGMVKAGVAGEDDGLIDSGTCGQNLTWKLDANGVLTISGEGGMADYYNDNAPWKAHREDILSIIIEDGVKTIGALAFKGCTQLTSVSLPDGLWTISSSAFQDCVSLKAIDLPDSITLMSNRVFENTGLESIKIPAGEIGLADGLFYGCTSLKSVEIHDGVTQIGRSFEGCTSLTQVKLPASLRYMGDKTFANCTSLTEIVIPDGMEWLNESIFEGCTALKEITIPASVVHLYWSALNNSGVTDIWYGGSESQWNEIDFRGTCELDGYVIHFGVQPPSDLIGSGTCGDNLTWELTMEGLLTISGTGEMYDWEYGDEDGRWYGADLQNVIIKDGVTSIGDYAFEDTCNLKSIQIPDSVVRIGHRAFVGSDVTEIILPDSVKTIDEYAFVGCHWLENIKIPDGVTRIEEGTFASCEALQTVTIPGGVTYIGDYAFVGCVSLTDVYFNGSEAEWNEVDVDQDNEELFNATIHFLGEPEIPSGPCGDNLTWALVDGVLTISGEGYMQWSGTTMPPWYGYRAEIYEVTMEPGVKNVGSNAFSECENLTNVVLPDGVEYIEGKAFAYNGNLREVTIPASVTYIDTGAFSHCSNLDDIYYGGTEEDWNRMTIFDGYLFVYHFPTVHYMGVEPVFPNVYFSDDGAIRVDASDLPDGYWGTFEVFYENGEELQSIMDGEVWGGDCYWHYLKMFDFLEAGNYHLTVELRDANGEVVGTEPLILTAAEDIAEEQARLTFAENSYTISGLMKNAQNLWIIGTEDDVKIIGADIWMYGSQNQYTDEYESIHNYEKLTLTAHAIQDYTVSDDGKVLFYTVTTLADDTDFDVFNWEVNGDTLTIRGNGPMPDWTWDWYYGIGWREYRGQIKKIIIEDGITTIGDNAFSEFWNLTSVSIPGSVTVIKQGAFSECENLTSVVIPEGVTDIENYAFGNCSNLTSISLPDTLTGISDQVFYNCDSLLTVDIPESVGVIGSNAFYDCDGLQKIVIPSGVVGIWHQVFYSCDNLMSVTLPEGLVSIGSSAFDDCTSLTKVNLPEGLVSIDKRAFAGTDSLSNVTIPDSVTSIGAEAFSGSGLTKVTIPAGIVEIKESTFQFCDNLTTVTIPEGIVRIGYNAFYRCENLSSVTLPESLTKIGTSAFYCCRNLKSVTIPANVLMIEGDAFRECESLVSLTIPEGVMTIGDSAFQDCSALRSVVLPDSVMTLGNWAFAGCTSMTSVILPKDLASIGESVFRGSGLRSVVLPDGLTSIGAQAFSYCEALTSVTIPDSLVTIGEQAFMESGLTSVEIPASVSKISNNAFDCCYYLKSVKLNEGLSVIGEHAFAACDSLRYITIPASVSKLSWGAFRGAGLYGVTILGVTNIDQSAFEDCDNLFFVILPDTLSHISERAFAGCQCLMDVYYAGSEDDWNDYVTVEEDSNEYLLYANFHYGYDGTEEIPEYDAAGTFGEGFKWTLMDGMLTIYGEGAMDDWGANDWDSAPWADYREQITQVTIQKGVTHIGAFAFYDCMNLTEVTIPDSVTTIGNSAFEGCSSLKSIDLHDGITAMGANALQSTGLESVVLPAGLTYLSESLFAHSTVKSVTIPEGVTEFGWGVFYGCESLTEVQLPNGLTDLGESCFENCTSLKEIVLPESLGHICSYVFYGCSALKEITMPAGMGVIYYYALHDCYALTDIYYGGSKEQWEWVSIEDQGSLDWFAVTVHYAGGGEEPEPDDDTTTISGTCGDLTWTLKDGVMTISGTGEMTDGDWGGQESNVTKLVIKEGATNVCDYAFSRFSNLTEVILPGSVAIIGDGAFNECRQLSEITLPEGLNEIGGSAFYLCTGLTEITLPATLTDIGSMAFRGCSGLSDVYYNGTEDDWNSVSVGSWNDELLNAEFYFSEDPDDDTTAISGTCGNALKWGLKEGVLTISGTGDMSSWNSDSDVPWYDFTEDITRVIVKDGVTSIGDWAFAYCWNLEELELADSITSIGDCAFVECGYLEDTVELPASLTELGASAFESSGLRRIEIPVGVEQIMNDTFSGCSSLEEVVLGDSVTVIGSYAFDGCTSLFTVSLPDSVDYIAPWAFASSGLTYITIPEGIDTIWHNTFEYCESLNEVTLPDSLRTIGEGAFVNCYALETIDLPEELNHIAPRAFEGSGLTSITIPGRMEWVPNEAFAGCEYLREVVLEEPITEIGNSAFEGCWSLECVEMPQSLRRIGNSAFCDTGLTSIEIPSEVTEIDDYAFAECTELSEVILPDCLERIGEHVFEGCTSLTSIEFPWDLKVIGEYAFARSGLEEVVTRGALERIEGYAFEGCENLTRVEISEGYYDGVCIETGAFYGCGSLEELWLAITVTVIGDEAFGDCWSLENIYYQGTEDDWDRRMIFGELNFDPSMITFLVEEY